LAPHLYGEPFLTKPPGAYAAIGLASIPFGRVTEETARLPCTIAASFTVLFAFGILRHYLGEGRAFAAAMLLPASLLWLDKAPSAEIDMLQLAWVAAAILSFLRAVEAEDRSRSASAWAAAALACVAGGFLTKWTAPAFFYLTAIPFLWQQGRLRWLYGRQHLIGASIAVAICLAWAILVAREVGWQTLTVTVWQEAAQRFAPQTQGKAYPWIESLKFPLQVLGASLPWSIPALLALRPTFLCSLGENERRLVQLLHCWVWPNLLFWSLPAQHHLRYVLPICPAISLLGVVLVSRWLKAVARTPRKIACLRAAFVCTIVAWAAVKIVFVETIMPARTADRNARETGERLSALVPEGEILYLCRLKDEGIVFYYARPARRLTTHELRVQPHYLLLLDEEWNGNEFRGRFIHVAALRDQQQATIHLVRFAEKDDLGWLAPVHPIPPTYSASPP
jgi:4-amino-4-deoxy-L-arabinose transferase-like glycosyltransferase